MIANRTRPAEILVVEDNPGDADLIVEFLGDGGRSRVWVARDGEQAMDFMHRQNGFAQAPRPDLVLLDLNIPREDGRQVLAEIKADPELQEIPVVVLTSSAAEQDVDTCYRLHANCYVAKPGELVRYEAVVKAIEEFWLGVARLPAERGGRNG